MPWSIELADGSEKWETAFKSRARAAAQRWVEVYKQKVILATNGRIREVFSPDHDSVGTMHIAETVEVLRALSDLEYSRNWDVEVHADRAHATITLWGKDEFLSREEFQRNVRPLLWSPVQVTTLKVLEWTPS